MKYFSRIGFVILTIALSCVSLNSIAGPGKKGFRSFVHSIAKNVELTNSQRADIRQLARQLKEDISVFSEDKETFRNSLESLLEAEEFDETAVTQLLIDNLSIEQSIGLLKAQFKHDVWALFTEEQQAAAESFFADRAFDVDATEEKLERLQTIYDKLELTDEQIVQADLIFGQALEVKTELTTELEAYKEAQSALITAETFSVDDWNALFEANSETFVQRKLNFITTIVEFKAILTEEQLEAFEDFAARRGRRF